MADLDRQLAAAVDTEEEAGRAHRAAERALEAAHRAVTQADRVTDG